MARNSDNKKPAESGFFAIKSIQRPGQQHSEQWQVNP
jgi:hypothetical protein